MPLRMMFSLPSFLSRRPVGLFLCRISGRRSRSRRYVCRRRTRRYALVSHPGAVDRIDIGARGYGRGRQRVDVAAVLLHGQLAVHELHRFEFLALDAPQQHIFLVGHLRPEPRGLSLPEHVDVDHFTVGREAHHHADRAAETVLGHRLHGVARDLSSLGCGVDRDRHIVDRQRFGYGLVERRKHDLQRLDLRRLLGLGDRFGRNHVHGAHTGRSHERDAEQYGRHIHKCTFHTASPPI